MIVRNYWRRARITATTTGIVGGVALTVLWLLDPLETGSFGQIVRFAFGTIALYAVVPMALASIAQTALMRWLAITKASRGKQQIVGAGLGLVLGGITSLLVAPLLPWAMGGIVGFGSILGGLNGLLAETTDPDGLPIASSDQNIKGHLR